MEVQISVTDRMKDIFEAFGPCVKSIPRERVSGLLPEGVDCYVVVAKERSDRETDRLHPHVFLCGAKDSTRDYPVVLWAGECPGIPWSFLKGQQVTTDEIIDLWHSMSGISFQEAFFTLVLSREAKVTVLYDLKMHNGVPVGMILEAGKFRAKTFPL